MYSIERNYQLYIHNSNWNQTQPIGGFGRRRELRDSMAIGRSKIDYDNNRGGSIIVIGIAS